MMRPRRLWTPQLPSADLASKRSGLAPPALPLPTDISEWHAMYLWINRVLLALVACLLAEAGVGLLHIHWPGGQQ